MSETRKDVSAREIKVGHCAIARQRVRLANGTRFLMGFEIAVIFDFAADVQIAVLQRFGLLRQGRKDGHLGAGGPSDGGVVGIGAAERDVSDAEAAVDDRPALGGDLQGKGLDEDLASEAVIGACERKAIWDGIAEIELNRPSGFVRVIFAGEARAVENLLAFDDFADSTERPRHFGLVERRVALETR